MSCVSKTFTAFLNNRISNFCEHNEILADEQNGFRKAQSCTDHIFNLTSIIRNRLNNKQSTFCTFIDLKKAFDWVDRALLMYRFIKYKIDGKVYNAIKSLYSNTWSCIRLKNMYTDFFKVKSGVRQGDSLSPTLFSLYINDLVNEIKKLNIGIKLKDEILSILLYADDMVLMADNEKDLQSLLDCVAGWCSKWKLSENIDKTKVVNFRPKR